MGISWLVSHPQGCCPNPPSTTFGYFSLGALVERLREVQSRLYEAVEAVLQGKIAELYPESAGRRIHLRLCCYDLPREPLDQFFARFVEIMRTHPEWKAQCKVIEFEIRHDTLKEKTEEPNQSPQRNAGSRPSSDDSSASETPSSLGPRG
jgi:hypothetical protein